MLRIRSKPTGKVRLDEGEFGVFPLTNPRRHLDAAQTLAGVGIRLSKSQNNGSFGLIPAFIRRMSAKLACR